MPGGPCSRLGWAAGGVWGLCWQWGWQRVPVPVDLPLFLEALWSVSAEGNAPSTPGTGGFMSQLLARWVCDPIEEQEVPECRVGCSSWDRCDPRRSSHQLE